MIRKMSIAKAALALEERGIERGISDSQNMAQEQGQRETINIDKKVGWKWATPIGSEKSTCNQIAMTPRRIKTTYCSRLR